MISRGCLHVPGIIVGVDTHKDLVCYGCAASVFYPRPIGRVVMGWFQRVERAERERAAAAEYQPVLWRGELT